MEERIYEIRLELDVEATHHPEVEERQPSVGHYAKVAGMRISVEEPVFKQLLQISPRKQSHHFVWVLPGGGQCFGIDDFQPVDELHHDDAARRKDFVDLRNVNLFPLREVLPK